MSRQDKATTEKHSKILRELVKAPENKVCGDCKRNDPRWASWNIGVFICIRCSGIHRSMGTHISRVKSIDLDTWTPEQMESIQKWGNHRANLYWEAHLKPGHIPPDHKVESFIRSKYESRRWAREGPPPSDPSMLETDAGTSSSTSAAPAPSVPPAAPRALFPPSAMSQQPRHSHRLLSTAVTATRTHVPVVQSQQAAQPQPAAPAAQQSTSAAEDLFSLDFHGPPKPAEQAAPGPPKDVKNDIMSLFSTATAPAAIASAPSNDFGGFTSAQSTIWSGQAQTQQAAAPQVTSMMGTSGTGAWGVQSGWNGQPAGQQQAPSLFGQASVWSSPTSATAAQPQASLFASSQNVWGSGNGTAAAGTTDLFSSSLTSSATATTQKKDDPFGDLWN